MTGPYLFKPSAMRLLIVLDCVMQTYMSRPSLVVIAAVCYRPFSAQQHPHRELQRLTAEFQRQTVVSSVVTAAGGSFDAVILNSLITRCFFNLFMYPNLQFKFLFFFNHSSDATVSG